MRQRNETYAWNGWYGTNIVLASYSYTALLQRPQKPFRILPIKVIFDFEIRWLATLKFKDALKENKKRKHLRGSGETANEKQDWKKMEGKWSDRFKFTRT